MMAPKMSASKLRPLLFLSPFSRFYSTNLIEPPSSSVPVFDVQYLRHVRVLSSPPFLLSFSKFFSSKSTKSLPLPLTRDGNYEESISLTVCPGCGVHMQDSNPKQPGFFVKPSSKDPNYRLHAHLEPVDRESEFSEFLKKGFVNEQAGDNTDGNVIKQSEMPVVCARCHSLRHYGKVKDPSVENLLPDFDFDHTVGRRLVSASGTRSVVLMVVDASDFDGSFPRKVAKLVSATIQENSAAWREGKSANVPRIVLVATKIDLLPSSVSPTRLEYWIRQRAREGGANKITSLHMVSSTRDWGLKNLIDDVLHLAGPRGCIWAIGAQNAGKSTLINSIGKHFGGKTTHLTEAPVPGTTLGIIRVAGVLPGQAKLFDTPGLLLPHQITTRLTREEQKLVHVSKELKPRTFRIKVGHTIHIAGLMRLDVEEASVDSLYITVWASPYLPLHMGKTENANVILEEHFGHQLQPPIGRNRVAELGKWVRKEVRVNGNSWDSSSMDIAAAGLGWFAVGLKGEAKLGAWTYEGIDVILRDSLIPFRSNFFEISGFTVSKIVSKADQAANKPQGQQENKVKKSGLKVCV